MQITSFSDLLKEAKEIQDYLEITCSDSTTEALERGRDLMVYMARSGKMLADAKMHLNTARNCARRLVPANVSAMDKKFIVEADTAEYSQLTDWLERINKTCYHQIEFLRTTISFSKAEMTQING